MPEPETIPPDGGPRTDELREFSHKGTDVFPQASTGGQDEQRPSILPLDSAEPASNDDSE